MSHKHTQHETASTTTYPLAQNISLRTKEETMSTSELGSVEQAVEVAVPVSAATVALGALAVWTLVAVATARRRRNATLAVGDAKPVAAKWPVRERKSLAIKLTIVAVALGMLVPFTDPDTRKWVEENPALLIPSGQGERW